MSRKYFGTDGVRGRVGVAPITPDFVMRLGYAAGKVLASDRSHLSAGENPVVLIGKDTRISGYMLEAALQAGLCAAGVNVRLVGPMPTPAIAYLTRALRLQAGVVISASHNPYEDNGIKFFSATGQKLADETELAIEAMLDSPMQTMDSAYLGRVKRIDDAAARYIEFCKSTFPFDSDLRGLRIVVDCAQGATYHVAPPVLHELGAEVIAIANQPNGMNINRECGATHTATLSAAVKLHRADFGIALDGDGDRLMMADRDGVIYDGDQLIYVIAKYRQQMGKFKGGVVGTLMTNLGMEHALERLNIPFMRAQVGDRYVLEMLAEQGWQLGGEASGHILCLDKHTTGDGIIAALQVLQVLQDVGMTLAQYTADMQQYPQTLLNVRLMGKVDLKAPLIQEAVAAAEQVLGATGRVVLRASGTEPLIRVMVECQSEDQARQQAELIATAVRNAVK
ncbi:phosphoglucosamine mutase [Sulfuriferula nivalis]|uniref:Phosphoglucosamine mutase n=1 Tax=Sulfuriferula nivalis TaxID=2675298 RepID=A0A809SEY8_9PROT|nr:phosphoglucosamine mutase [Sulfuriferula nivalis]BBP01827.1 phosphoglucosamine mutase [Sulfuriferula nivalis]